MTTHGPIIRPATAADAEALSVLARDTFCENFAHLYTADNLQQFLDGVYAPRLQQQEIQHPENFFRLVEQDGKLIGYVKACPCHLPVADMPAGAYEVQRLYIRAEAKAAGLGSKLMDECLHYFAAQGASSVYLGVWAENHAAQKFYQRYGFRKVGEYHFMVGTHADNEWIMQLEHWPKQG